MATQVSGLLGRCTLGASVPVQRRYLPHLSRTWNRAWQDMEAAQRLCSRVAVMNRGRLVRSVLDVCG
jgi:hypothetical protein